MIKLIETEEIHIIEKLHKKIFGEEFPINDFLEKKKSKILRNYVFYLNNSIIGYTIAFDRMEKFNFHLWIGGILPEFQNKGYYSKVLDEFINMSKRKNYKEITLSSYNHRPNMLRLLIKKEFKIIGTVVGKYGDQIKILFKYDVQEKLALRISLTSSCNFKCFFCHGEGLDSSKKIFLQKEKLEKILLQGKKNGCREVTFTGGEPLLNKKGLYFGIKYCGEMKSPPSIKIVTNGSLIDEKFINLIKEYPGDISINLSVHGMNSLDYERITQVKGYFNKVLEKIILLKKNEISFRLNCVLLKDVNSGDLSLKKFIEKCLEYEINKVTFLELLITESMQNISSYLIDYDKIKNLINSVGKDLGEINIITENKKKVRFLLETEKRDIQIDIFKLTCSQGCAGCLNVKDKTIGPDGEYYPCFAHSDISLGNVSENMKDAFEKGKAFIRSHII